MKFYSLLLASLLFTASGTASAAVIDFNGMSNKWQNSYSEDGFQLEASIGEFKNLGNDFVKTKNNKSFLTLTQVDNEAFNFSSIVFNKLLPLKGKKLSENSISFIGYNGSDIVAQQTYTETDISVKNTLLSFTGFQGVTSVTWGNAEKIEFGNINVNSVSAIPEPATYALMLAGLGLVGFMAARRQRTHA